MATRVGVGVRSSIENKEIIALQSQIRSLNEEISILRIEKNDLEVIPTELKKQVEDLTVEKSRLEAENSNLAKQVEDLTKIVEETKKNKSKE